MKMREVIPIFVTRCLFNVIKKMLLFTALSLSNFIRLDGYGSTLTPIHCIFLLWKYVVYTGLNDMKD